MATPPFDPDLPEDGALIIAGVLRDQLNALNDDIATRATQTALDAAVTDLQADIDTRATQSTLDSAVAGLNDALSQRPDYSWVVNAVNGATDSTLATALAQSSNNSNAVSTFSEPAYSSYDQSQMQRLIDKVDELIGVLRR